MRSQRNISGFDTDYTINQSQQPVTTAGSLINTQTLVLVTTFHWVIVERWKVGLLSLINVCVDLLTHTHTDGAVYMLCRRLGLSRGRWCLRWTGRTTPKWKSAESGWNTDSLSELLKIPTADDSTVFYWVLQFSNIRGTRTEIERTSTLRWLNLKMLLFLFLVNKSRSETASKLRKSPTSCLRSGETVQRRRQLNEGQQRSAVCNNRVLEIW